MPEHVSEHGDADPLGEALPARLEGPALRRHGEEEGQAHAAKHQRVVPGGTIQQNSSLISSP